MRAIEPTVCGYAVNPDDATRIYYEAFGSPDAEQTIVFLPTWNIVHSRAWKMQVPYFAQRGFRVITYDPRGNGKSDRPVSGYEAERVIGDAIAVFQAAGVNRAAVVGLSAGARIATVLAIDYPDLVDRIIFIGAAIRFVKTGREAAIDAFTNEPPDRQGWNKFNAVHWRENYLDFLEWFMRTAINVPHSSKGIEDAISWGLETTPEILIASQLEGQWPDMTVLAPSIRCPTLILHGSEDLVNPVENAYRLRDTIPNSWLVVFEGNGHNPAARDPVRANELMHDFLGREQVQITVWPRALSRQKRALFISSPIGLGHIQRDLAIADELRALIPDLHIDWLAQNPVTAVLETRGECIHPLSEHLAGEAAHIEAELSGEHTLHAFEAVRRMDEILYTNFEVFSDATRETPYDLWYGDEAWDVDHFLHENPERKTAPFVWLTDFVGNLPATDDERERDLITDYNAEMIEHIERFPAVRDLSLFIGTPDDIVPDRFGPGLPSIREWTEAHFEFVDYVRYFDPEALADRTALRERFGFGPDERIAVAAVGGTGVGSTLLTRIIGSYPVARELVPELRLVVVCGPRIDPSAFPEQPGVEYVGYVHDLYELLAAADVALVQGGLSTTMELVALNVPFLYFPLREHFEQQRHVAFRLERYGVPEWARMHYDEADAMYIANRLVRALNEPQRYHPVAMGGARRAAERIAGLFSGGGRVHVPLTH